MTENGYLGVFIPGHTDKTTGLSLDALGDLEPYWETVRALYAPFKVGRRSPTGTLYRHAGLQASQVFENLKAVHVQPLDGRWPLGRESVPATSHAITVSDISTS